MNTQQLHLQQWLAQPLIGPHTGFTRLELVDLAQLARLAALTEGRLHAFAQEKQPLSSVQFTKLLTVLKAFGYEELEVH